MIRRGLAATVFAILAGMFTTTPALASGPAPGTTGFDISWPQCPSNFPPTTAPGWGIVGVNDGKAWTGNPCLSSEYGWMAARGPSSFYINTGNPGTKSPYWTMSGPKSCANAQQRRSVNDAGCAYNYGWNAAGYAFSLATAAPSSTSSAQAASWWLDVETANSWDGTGAANSADIQGGIDYLASRGVASIGVYSTQYQWNQITGGYRIPNPNWVAGAQSLQQAQQFCSAGTSYSFTGGPVTLTQYPSGNFDGDYAC